MRRRIVPPQRRGIHIAWRPLAEAGNTGSRMLPHHTAHGFPIWYLIAIVHGVRGTASLSIQTFENWHIMLTRLRGTTLPLVRDAMLPAGRMQGEYLILLNLFWCQDANRADRWLDYRNISLASSCCEGLLNPC